MKPLLCLLLTVLVPILCRGESVTLTDAPDWQPMADAQREAVLKAFNGKNVRLIDGSIRTGGGATTFIAMPFVVTSKPMYDGEIAGYIKGVTGTGAKLLDQQTETLAGLPGISAAFQGKANGGDLFILGYQFFTNRDIYAITFYTTSVLARTDPMVTSYLGRIKVDPSVKPADIRASSPLAGLHLPGPALNDTSPYALGYRVGQLLVVVLVIFLIVKGLAAIIGSSRKQKSTPPPPMPRL